MHQITDADSRDPTVRRLARSPTIMCIVTAPCQGPCAVLDGLRVSEGWGSVAVRRALHGPRHGVVTMRRIVGLQANQLTV